MRLSFYYQLVGLLMGVSLATLPIHAQSVHAQNTDNSNALASLFSQSNQKKFLPVHQAFGVEISQNNQELIVRFNITPKHYIYQDKIIAQLPDGVSASNWQFSRDPVMVDDPEFGQVAVFKEDVVAKAIITTQKNLNNAPISIKWQGCAEAGLCYPPEASKATLNLKASNQPVHDEDQKTQVNKSGSLLNQPAFAALGSQNMPDPSKNTNNQNTSGLTIAQESAAPKQPAAPNQAHEISSTADNNQTKSITTEENTEDKESTTQTKDLAISDDGTWQPTDTENFDDDQNVADTATDNNAINHTLADHQNDPFGLQKNPLLALMLLFLAGLLLAFTPCVYPMIPIVANIVARQKNNSTVKGFVLSSSYGIGVATAYGAIGALVAGLGRAVGILGYLQNSYVLIGFALVFAVLALAMFDVIKLSLPSVITEILSKKSQAADNQLGSVGGSFVVGALSALVVSPCVSLPMAGALTAVSTSESVLLGFFALFVFGLGLSLPLMILGAVQGKFMPKAGQWMQQIKAFCGLLLLAVAISLLERVLHSFWILVFWACWFALLCVWFYRQKVLLAQALSFVSGIWTVCLMIGVATGHNDPWRPLEKLTATNTAKTTLFAKNSDIYITNLNQLDEILAKNDKVLVDITANWCIECKIMEKTLFTDRPAKLAEFVVVKVDISDNTKESKAVLARYDLFGPPALLFYKKGQLNHKLLGEVKRADFEKTLSQL